MYVFRVQGVGYNYMDTFIKIGVYTDRSKEMGHYYHLGLKKSCAR